MRALFSSFGFAVVLTLFGVGPSVARAEKAESLERVIAGAEQDSRWAKATTTTERIRLVRESALRYSVSSKPVSDRYLITALGGPIDLVHFLGLAKIVCSGEETRERALFDQWEREGGYDFETRQTRTHPTSASPDDLPSNALGALFGQELRSHNGDAAFDFPKALRDFFAPLEPLPDAIAKRFSHDEVVMGLSDNASAEAFTKRHTWFSALPLYILPLIEPERAKVLPDSVATMRRAGFAIIPYKGRPILTERLAKK